MAPHGALLLLGVSVESYAERGTIEDSRRNATLRGVLYWWG